MIFADQNLLSSLFFWHLYTQLVEHSFVIFGKFWNFLKHHQIYFVYQANFLFTYKEEALVSLSLCLFCYDLRAKEYSHYSRCSADPINSPLINHSVVISMSAAA